MDGIGLEADVPDRSSLPSVSYARGLGAGIAAFLVSYAVTFGLVLLEIANSAGEFGLYTRPNGADALLSVVGGTFYAAHWGAYDVPVGLGRTLELYTTVPDIVYSGLVFGTLVIVGFLTARSVDASGDPVECFGQGAAIAIGYVPLLGLNVLALGLESDSSPAVFLQQSPDLLLGGLVYAVAFGGLGGFLASLWSRK